MRCVLGWLVLAAGGVVGGVFVPAGPASALSCVGPEAVLRDAPSIIVGRITEWDEERVSIAVDEVWKGSPPPARVEYGVELAEWWEMDGLVRPRVRTVFAPRDGALNPCTVFSLEGFQAEQVQAFRPESPAAPEPVDGGVGERPTGADGDEVMGVAAGPRTLLVGAGLLVGMVLCAAWVLRRRRV